MSDGEKPELLIKDCQNPVLLKQKLDASIWSFIALILAGLSLILATVLGTRAGAIVVSSVGLSTAALSAAFVWKKGSAGDKVGLGIAAALSVVVLALALFVPSLVNTMWVFDVPVAAVDPNQIVVVPRSNVIGPGVSQAEHGAADAPREATRQGDVIVRINSAKLGKLGERGGKEFLLVHLRLGNLGHHKKYAFDGFSKGKHEPRMYAPSGQSFAFVEQRDRVVGADPMAFESGTLKTSYVLPGRLVDVQLVFEPPPPDFSNVTIEMPGEAWGLKGITKVRLPGIFEKPVSSLQQK